MAWPTTSRHERGYGTEHDKMRALLLREVVTCEECERNGIETPGTIADHIKPLAQGGTGERSNYQLLCKPCSDAKTLADKGVRAPVGCDAQGWPVGSTNEGSR